MYNLLPIIIILVCLIIIIAIIIRKFPALAILDVENIPEEKVARIKEKIISERLERDLRRLGYHWRGLSAIGHKLQSFFVKIWENLEERRDRYRQEKKLATATTSVRIDHLLKQAKALIDPEDTDALSEAEEKLIEVISLDSKNLPAFIELGEVYHYGRKFAEAKQTFLYVLKLLEFKDDKNKEAEINFILADINKNLDDIDEACENVLESLKIEPNNPRYLDTLLEISILKKDKDLANAAYERLEAVNPENQKLSDWKEQLDNL